MCDQQTQPAPRWLPRMMLFAPALWDKGDPMGTTPTARVCECVSNAKLKKKKENQQRMQGKICLFAHASLRPWIDIKLPPLSYYTLGGPFTFQPCISGGQLFLPAT